MDGRHRRSPVWAIAAALWALLFAIPNAYWGRGGSAGAATIAAHPDEIPLLRDSTFVVGSALAKVAAGLLVLAVGYAWGGPRCSRWLRTLALLGGAGMLVYGVALAIQHGLMVAGAVATPATLGERASRWHLVLWDPIWVLGGVLFLMTTRIARMPDPRNAVR